jgi:hypothetical protein
VAFDHELLSVESPIDRLRASNEDTRGNCSFGRYSLNLATSTKAGGKEMLARNESDDVERHTKFNRSFLPVEQHAGSL